MGSLWRSEEMSLSQLFLQSEAAYECVSALGELGLVQFEDLNGDTNAYQRKYVNELRRCDEMNRKLRFFEKEICNARIEIDGPGNAVSDHSPDSTQMQQMEVEFERLEKELIEINGNTEALLKQELELLEMKEILTKTGRFFDSADLTAVAERTTETMNEQKMPLMSAKDDRRGQLGFVAGVISREKSSAFERLTWRACRGNVFIRIIAIEHSKDIKGEEVMKDVFIIFFQGSQLETRVRKICEGFAASLYPCPDNAMERREMCVEVDTRLADLQNILSTTRDHLRKNLGRIAYQLSGWQVKVTKIKAIFHTMNKFNYDSARTSLIGQCWCPLNQLGAIREALRAGAERSGTGAQPILTPLQTKKQPPTYHVTNKFTSAFQTIVDAYGVASYQEVNPGPFTIITFPFLFAVMFGDFGHGLLMFLFAFYLVRREDTLAAVKGGGEIWDTIFGGRYIVLLMGIFSMYTGFIYNDCFSKAMTIVPSGWTLPNPEYIIEDAVTMQRYRADQLPNNFTNPAYAKSVANPNLPNVPAQINECDAFGCFAYAYPIGIDPVWMGTSNKLSFTNSYKMKMSVILGVLQMAFGTILSSYNARFFKRRTDLIHVFIPEIIFLLGIFGYLVIMVFKKWGTNPADSPNPGSTPSLLLMLINMFLNFGANPAPEEVLYGSADGSTQGKVQMILVLLAVACVPWMLCVKPYKIKQEMKAHEKNKKIVTQYTENNDDDGGAALAVGHEDEEEEEHDFSEVVVHQAIHTIEFCLGCISNTASYLRLWALSLAHAELSEVLWEMVLEKGLSMEGGIQPVVIFAAFAMWAVLTVAVLLIMEGLSAFLHALRLHWVEFQNKFYVGQGYLFHPFSFHIILENGEDELQ
eukprot:m.1637452 g.1637452  ORF g.1637452 m.1637452 type:complete len:867 (-) comp25829_c0_seq1:222-2822(-)